MTRKDYIVIAEVLRVEYHNAMLASGEQAYAVVGVAKSMCHSLHRDNPRFNSDHFMAVVRGRERVIVSSSKDGAIMRAARISTEFEILICDAMDHIKQLEIERLDDCGRVTSTFECEEQDEMDAFTIAGNDLEHVEEFRKAVRSYREEERWVS